MIKKLIVIALIFTILLSLPVAFDRWNRETASDSVDVVIDYDSVVKVTSKRINVQEETRKFLEKLKEAGATGVALQEATLDRLNKQKYITVLSGDDVNKYLVMEGKTERVDPNNTFVVFDEKYISDLKPLISQGFEQSEFRDYSFGNNDAVEIAQPFDAIKEVPIGINPVTARMITEELGMNLIPRISNLWMDTPTHVNILKRIDDTYAPYAIAFEGEEVIGFHEEPGKNQLDELAAVLKKRNILIANIEGFDQRGMGKLGAGSGYNVVRLHSIRDLEMSSIKTDVLADRLVRAATERNIRMLYINAADAPKKTANRLIEKTVDVVELAVKGDEDNRGLSSMFDLGKASSFQPEQPAYASLLKWVSVVGGLLLIGFMASHFWRGFLYLIPAAGILGIGAAYVVVPSLVMLGIKAIALGAAISAPTLAGITVVNLIKNYSFQNTRKAIIDTLGLFFLAALISISGAILVVGMLSHVQFSLYLNQFSGVKLLHVAPMALIFVYIAITFNLKPNKIVFSFIRVYHLLIIAVIALVGLYYVMRTGNVTATAVTPIEMAFRNTVEQWLGIRPRTKEFLFGHPLWIVATFIALRYPKALYLFVPAIIGQLSMVSTFTHLHSALWVSLIRTGLGLVLGVVIGLILIFVWSRFAKTKWGRSLLNAL